MPTDPLEFDVLFWLEAGCVKSCNTNTQILHVHPSGDQ